MSRRDPELTKHNQIAEELTERLQAIEAQAVADSGRSSAQSVHAAYGGKHDILIDTKNTVIHSADQFVNLWLEGYMKFLDGEIESGLSPNGAMRESFIRLQRSEILQRYVFLFLQRTYHRHYRSLSKNRPPDEKAFHWIGQERANYGLFVTPPIS